MALAGSEERAGCKGMASVSAIHAPFTTEVECEMASVITLEFESHEPLIRLDAQNAVRLSPLKDRPLKCWPEL
jgi:hypothetical protein